MSTVKTKYRMILLVPFAESKGSKEDLLFFLFKLPTERLSRVLHP
jgi:hypothetical protein